MNSNVVVLGRGPLRAVQAVAIGMIVFHFVHLALAGVFMDEAYYWMWGQHPALSYYDHPPLNAWLLGLSSAVFGWNTVALRLPVALSFVADIAAIWLLSRRLCGDDWRGHFWVTLLLFLTTPIYWMVTAVALPDHTLLTACLFALYCFTGFFLDRSRGETGRNRDLYFGAVALGFAGLSKYNAAFLGLALVAYVVLFHRPLLREARLWLAGAITLAMQLPVVIWNASERFASWEFIFHGRHAGLKASLDGLPPLVIGIAVFLSPFLLWPIIQFGFTRRGRIAGAGLARTTFLISTVAIVAVSFTTLVLFHWNLVAYVAMLPFLAYVMRPRLLLPLQALYGVVFAVGAFVNYAVVPVTDVRAWKDSASAWSYGWAPTAAYIAEAKAGHAVGFVAATDYTTASLLGFALRDPDVTSLSVNQEQYDYWFDRQAHAGEDAIVFADRWRALAPSIRRQFDSVTELASLRVRQHGRDLDTHRVYLAKGFRPDG